MQTLFNDQYNPLFRQLVDEKDIKCILVASLLHDLGYYPLAHELEEIEKMFEHEQYTIKFLDSTIQDREGRTLTDIIENDEWGWGIPIDSVRSVLNHSDVQKKLFYNQKPKEKMLRSIINGPIDVDKLDYILRDSQNCYLKYGEIIDFDRLVRNVTIVISKLDKGNTDFSLGVYERGQSAAESLTLARYLMYQTVYWHRTSRAVRAMLREALKSLLAARFETGKDKYKEFFKTLDKSLGIDGKPKNFGINEMLDLIEKWAGDNGKDIIQMIKKREYYKRIITIHESGGDPDGSGKKSLLQVFRQVHKRAGFQEELQRRFKVALSHYLDSTTQASRLSILTPERTDKTIEMLSKESSIICDAPEPSYGTKDQLLRIMPEPERLHKNYFSRVDAGMRVSEVWNQVYFRLMNIAAKGRVFCHPDIRDTLMAAIGIKEVMSLVKDVLNEY